MGILLGIGLLSGTLSSVKLGNIGVLVEVIMVVFLVAMGVRELGMISCKDMITWSFLSPIENGYYGDGFLPPHYDLLL